MSAVVEGYARISLDGDGRGLGVERQCEDVTTTARVWNLPLDPSRIVIENDPPSAAGKASRASASTYSTKPREKYLALVERVRTGQTTHVIAYSTSRLTRNMIEREELLALRHAGATIITSQGQRIYPGMSSSEVDMIRMLGVQDTGYSDRISESTKRAFDQNATNGTPHGPIAYGWDRHHDKGAVVDTINDDQAAVLREVAARMIEGEATRAIARDLNEREIPAPRGGQWSTTILTKLMLRERNAARRVHRGVVVGPAAWEAIYDDETHAAVVAHLRDPERLKPKGAQRNLLSGLLICGRCGSSRMWVTYPGASARAKGQTPAYQCHDCHGIRRKQEPIDLYVVERVCDRLARPDALDWRAHDPKRLDAARANVERLRGLLAERVDMLNAEELTRAEFTRSATDLRERIAVAEAEVEAARPTPGAVRGLIGLGSVEDTREAFERLSLDQKRDVVRTLVTITINPTERRKFDASAIDLVWASSSVE